MKNTTMLLFDKIGRTVYELGTDIKWREGL